MYHALENRSISNYFLAREQDPTSVYSTPFQLWRTFVRKFSQVILQPRYAWFNIVNLTRDSSVLSGLLDTTKPFNELLREHKVNCRATKYQKDAEFSKKIRQWGAI